jgi:hypothetical protein
MTENWKYVVVNNAKESAEKSEAEAEFETCDP